MSGSVGGVPGKSSENIGKMLFIAIAWCVVLVGAAAAVWKWGKKKYESVGV